MDSVGDCARVVEFLKGFYWSCPPEYVTLLIHVSHVVASPEKRLIIAVVFFPHELLFFFPAQAGHLD